MKNTNPLINTLPLEQSASFFGQNGMNAINIKEWLRHENIKTSLVYTGLNTDSLRQAAKEVDAKIIPLLNNQLQLPA